MYELTVESTFAAAHQLNNYDGACEALHGHNWRVQIIVQTEKLNDIGLAIDFKTLKQALKNHLGQLDHTYLNQLPPFTEQNPSSENIACRLYQQLSRDSALQGVKLDRVIVWESENACAAYFEK
ncbi:MAG: 6-carboxytetrahydropterin synthase QueD [Candidatus Schekmanbacteria bacterium]|nr:6-carboxytetrahydropterin synthase QueD [Candidatus Schekmanbacteria bacterium]